MESSTKFYPFAPSPFPNPRLDLPADYETNYANFHCHHDYRKVFRSRTLNEAVAKPPSALSAIYSTGTIESLIRCIADVCVFSLCLRFCCVCDLINTGIYAQHGSGSYSVPYYRRDSKGYRKPYTQPSWVDSNWQRESDSRRYDKFLRLSAANTSLPVYSKASYTAAGPVFAANWRNSGVYSPYANPSLDGGAAVKTLGAPLTQQSYYSTTNRDRNLPTMQPNQLPPPPLPQQQQMRAQTAPASVEKLCDCGCGKC